MVEISAGELLDKITMLQLKTEKLRDLAQVKQVRAELEPLLHTWCAGVPPTRELQSLTAALTSVNRALWDVEDQLRACERDGEFGAQFVTLSRTARRHRERRSALRCEVNVLLGSALTEENPAHTFPEGQAA